MEQTVTQLKLKYLYGRDLYTMNADPVEKDFASIVKDAMNPGQIPCDAEGKVDKQKLPWYLFATSSMNTRNFNDIKLRTAIALDIDATTPAALEGVRRILREELNVIYLMYTTVNATPNNPKARVIVPVLPAIARDDYLAHVYALADAIRTPVIKKDAAPAECVSCIDPCSESAAQIMFTPTRKGIHGYYETWNNLTGNVADFTEPAAQIKAQRKNPSKRPKQKLSPYAEELNAAFTIEEGIAKWLSHLLIRKGNRYSWHTSDRTSADIIGDELVCHDSNSNTEGLKLDLFDVIRVLLHKGPAKWTDDPAEGYRSQQATIDWMKQQPELTELCARAEAADKARRAAAKMSRHDFYATDEEDTTIITRIMTPAAATGAASHTSAEPVESIAALDRTPTDPVARFNELIGAAIARAINGTLPAACTKQTKDGSVKLANESTLRYAVELLTKDGTIKKHKFNPSQMIVSDEYLDIRASQQQLLACARFSEVLNTNCETRKLITAFADLYKDHAKEYNPHLALAQETPWDRVDRISTLFIDNLGCEDNEENRGLARMFMAALAQTALKPDGARPEIPYMFLFLGPQGVGKSSLLRKLAGKRYHTEYYLSSLEGYGARDVQVNRQRGIIAECPEMEGLNKVAIETLKSDVTQFRHTVREAYAREHNDNQRNYILCGTANADADTGLLKDTGGNRRFVGIWCGQTDKTLNAQNHDINLGPATVQQIWAQALAQLMNEQVVLDKFLEKDAINEMQSSLIETPEMMNEIREWLDQTLPIDWHRRNESGRVNRIMTHTECEGAQQTAPRTVASALIFRAEFLKPRGYSEYHLLRYRTIFNTAMKCVDGWRVKAVWAWNEKHGRETTIKAFVRIAG